MERISDGALYQYPPRVFRCLKLKKQEETSLALSLAREQLLILKQNAMYKHHQQHVKEISLDINKPFIE